MECHLIYPFEANDSPLQMWSMADCANQLMADSRLQGFVLAEPVMVAAPPAAMVVESAVLAVVPLAADSG
jgi:hypothetical protein